MIHVKRVMKAQFLRRLKCDGIYDETFSLLESFSALLMNDAVSSQQPVDVKTKSACHKLDSVFYLQNIFTGV